MKNHSYFLFVILISVMYVLLFIHSIFWVLLLGADIKMEFILCFIFPSISIYLFFKKEKTKKMIIWHIVMLIMLPIIAIDILAVTQVIEEPGGKNTFDKKLFVFDEKVFDKMPLYIKLKDILIKNQDVIFQEFRKNNVKKINEDNIETQCYFINLYEDIPKKLPLLDSLISQIIEKIEDDIQYISFCDDKSLKISVKSEFDSSKNRYYINYQADHVLNFHYNIENDISFGYHESHLIQEKDTIIYKEWYYEVFVYRQETFYH